MARTVLPVDLQTDLKAIEKGLAEMAMTESDAITALGQLQNADGTFVYSADEAIDIVNNIRQRSYRSGYGTPEEMAVGDSLLFGSATPATVVPRPDKGFVQRVEDAFKLQSVKPETAGIESSFEWDFDGYKNYLIQQGVDSNIATKHLIGLNSVYKIKRREGLNQEESLAAAQEEINNLETAKDIEFDFDKNALRTQVRQSSQKFPDYTPAQMAYVKALKNKEVNDRIYHYKTNVFPNKEYDHTKILVDGQYEVDIPTDLLIYIENNKRFEKPFTGYIHEDNIIKGNYEIVSQTTGPYEDLLKKVNLYTQNALAKALSEVDVGAQPRNIWYLDPELKDAILTNPEQFIDEGLLSDTMYTGGTTETMLGAAFRYIGGFGSIALETAAPAITPVMALATEYIAEPISSAIQAPFSDDVEKTAPLTLGYIVGAEERRQQKLKETTPQYASDEWWQRIPAGFAKGTTFFELGMEAIEGEGYDLLTKTIVGVPYIGADVLNPIDPLVLKFPSAVIDTKNIIKVERALGEGGVTSIKPELTKQFLIRAEKEPVVKAIIGSMPQKYQKALNSGGDIENGYDIRFQAGSKIRREIEAHEHFTLLTRTNDTSVKDAITSLENNFPTSILTRQTARAKSSEEAKTIYEKHSDLLFNNNDLASLRTYYPQKYLVDTLEIGSTAERAVEAIKRSDNYKELKQKFPTANNDINSALKYIRRNYGHNYKLNELDIVNIRKALQHRMSLMATIDLFPKGLNTLRHVRRLTDRVFVDDKSFKKIEDSLADNNIMKTFLALATDKNNMERLLQSARIVEADYLRGSYTRNKDWEQMIYYNVTRDRDATALRLDVLSNADKNMLLREVARLPLKRDERRRILTDIRDNNRLFLTDQRRIVDTLLEQKARELQVDLPVEMVSNLSKAEQKTLASAVGSPDRASLYEDIKMLRRDVGDKFTTAYEILSKRLDGRLARFAKGLKTRVANQASREINQQVKLMKLDPESLPYMQEQMLKEARQGLTVARNQIGERLKNVRLEFEQYGLTEPPKDAYQAFSAYIRGKTQVDGAGKLAQRSDLASMFEVILHTMLAPRKEVLNYSYLDDFYDTKVFTHDKIYTAEGLKELRLFAEAMTRDLIDNPTDFTRILTDGVYEWRDILHKRYVYDGDDRINLLKSNVVPTDIQVPATPKELADGILNEYMRGYLIQEVFKAQAEAVHDIALPMLDDVNLQSLTPSITVSRPEYFKAAKALAKEMIRDFDRRRNYDTATQLLNSAAADTAIADIDNLRDLLETFDTEMKELLRPGYTKSYERTIKTINRDIDARLKIVKDEYTAKVDASKEVARLARESVKGERTKEAKLVRIKAKKQLEQEKTSHLNQRDKRIKNLEKDRELQLELNNSQYNEIMEQIEKSDQEELFEFYFEAVRSDVVKADVRFDEFIQIKRFKPIRYTEYDENVFNLVQYVENVAIKNDLFDRGIVETDMQSIANVVDDIFGSSNRLGQAYFGEQNYAEFFRMYEQHGLSHIDDVFEILKKDQGTLKRDFLKFMGYLKNRMYEFILSFRTRFLGQNALTAPAIELATTGRVSSPKDIIQGYNAVFRGRTPQSADYYKVAVTDRFGRSYTYGEIYKAIESKGVATDLSYARSLLQDGEIIKLFKDAGLSEKNIKTVLGDTYSFITGLPIQADMAHRVGNTINAIRKGQNLTDAVKGGTESLLNYMKLKGFEQNLQKFLFFYVFNRQITVTAFKTLFNADRLVNTIQLLRAKKDFSLFTQMTNDGKDYPYQATMPNYMQVRAGFQAYMKENSEKDVWLFSPAVPLFEGYANLINVLDMGGGNNKAREEVLETVTRLINPNYSGFLTAPQRHKRVPPEIVGLAYNFFGSDDGTQQFINNLAGDRVIPVHDPGSVYAINGMVYNLSKEQEAQFWRNMSLVGYVLRKINVDLPPVLEHVVDVLDPVRYTQTAIFDYYKIFDGEGTPYENLNTTERVLAGSGAYTPMRVTKPKVTDLEQTLRRLQQMRERVNQQKEQEEGFEDPR